MILRPSLEKFNAMVLFGGQPVNSFITIALIQTTMSDRFMPKNRKLKNKQTKKSGLNCGMIRNTACTNLCWDCLFVLFFLMFFFFLKTSELTDKIEIISMKSQKTQRDLCLFCLNLLTELY